MEITINYPPKFRRRYGGDEPNAHFIEQLLQSRLPEQTEFLDSLSAVHSGLDAIAVDLPEESLEPRWRQDWMPPLDGISIYGMIARKRPAVFLEIGSGNSTKFAARAIKDLGLDTKIVSIDPQPRAEIDELADHIERQSVEAIDLEIFDQLGPNDIVFFDGSHRCLQNSDVTVFFIDILPRLQPGTTISVHDIFWPMDYPQQWTKRYYSEQYVLGAFMLALGAEFPCVFSSAYMWTSHGESISQALPDSLVKRLSDASLRISGGCMWFDKPAIEFTR